MKIAQIREFDCANGPGIRTTVFVSGCTHNCKGCFNKEYQDFNYGVEFEDVKDKIFEGIKKTNKLSILGGEPLQQDKDMFRFVSEVKRKFPTCSIWMWTGYEFDKLELKNDLSKILTINHLDVIVDGKFKEELKDVTLKFKGSSNQRVIDVQSSIKVAKVIIKEGYR